MELNDTQIRYLIVMAALREDGDIRSVDIAAELNVSRTVVHKRLESLIELELITKKKYRNIRFTETGLTLATELQAQYRDIYPFFHTILGLDQEEARESTLAFLCNLSSVCLRHLRAYVLQAVPARIQAS